MGESLSSICRELTPSGTWARSLALGQIFSSSAIPAEMVVSLLQRNQFSCSKQPILNLAFCHFSRLKQLFAFVIRKQPCVVVLDGLDKWPCSFHHSGAELSQTLFTELLVQMQGELDVSSLDPFRRKLMKRSHRLKCGSCNK